MESARKDAQGDWESDYQSLVSPLIADTDPCYIFFRLDSTDANGAYRWLFICYVPDNAHVSGTIGHCAGSPHSFDTDPLVTL